MRIAYVAPYQGAEVLRRRPSTGNLALAGNLKIELVAELLARKGHDVEILSQGECGERSARYFPAFEESTGGERPIPVYYASALPIRFITGYWSASGLLSIFKARHAARPFDAVIIYNLKVPQVTVAFHVAERLGLPTIVEFEDDSFVDIVGKATTASIRARQLRARELQVLEQATASICVSPHLQTRFRPGTPSVLLRGVISEQITEYAARSPSTQRKNIVAFSGTFTPHKGLVQLVEAWKSSEPKGWELHIAGDGVIAAELRDRARDVKSIKFRGLLNRHENAAFLAECKIGINPHDVSAVLGNVFAFKIIEYLAAGLHVISTPMGPVEPELEAGMTYIADNAVASVAKGLGDVIGARRYERLAAGAAVHLYGGDAVASALDRLLRGVAAAPGVIAAARA
jgi:glycosyltransferase involved in cell wall biosynthesis